MPSDRASAGQSTVERSSPGGTCTEITWKSCAVPRWVTGRPGGGRHADRAADAGNHRHRHAGPQAGEHLLAAAAEDERVTALEPDHELPARRVRDERLVDLVLRHLPR